MNLRQFLQVLSDQGIVRSVSAEVDPCLELAALLHHLDGTPVMCEKLKGSSMRAVGNIFTSR